LDDIVPAESSKVEDAAIIHMELVQALVLQQGSPCFV